MRSAPKGIIPPTLRDDKLEEEAEQLRQHYMARAVAQVEGAQTKLAPLTAEVAELNSNLEEYQTKLGDMWWTALLQWASDAKIADKLIEDVKGKMAGEARDMTPQFLELVIYNVFFYTVN